ncbi:MAG TPA: FG-GAP-like repeat-containing protein, partial [Urbifossiella sp.]|nr:FG-GAP-like repeat-containing protein [Urbifossiella sp.]
MSLFNSWLGGRAPRKPPRRVRLDLERFEPRDNPTAIYATGAAPGSAPVVTVFNASTQAQLFTINAYDPSFTGGVNVAIGDVNGDGTPDIITGAGAGGGPVVNVYSGVDGTELGSFTAGDADSRAGVTVAAADYDGDGKADIVVGTMRNGEPLVQVIRFSDQTVLHGYTPFDGVSSVSVATGDVDKDGVPDTIIGAGAGGAPRVVVFSGATDATITSFTAFEDTFTGGVSVSAGDVNGDGKADVIVSAGNTGGPRVEAFDGQTAAPLLNFFAYDDTLRDGVMASVFNNNGTTELITSEGTGGANQVAAFDAQTLAQLTAPTAGVPSGGSYDVAPTVTVTTTASSTTNVSPIPFTATFSAAVNGFSAAGITVTNGTVSDFTETDAKTYTFDVTPTADGAVTVTVSAGAATDAAGNGNTASTAVSVTSDTGTPTVTANALTTNSSTPTLTGTVSDSSDTVTVTVGGQTLTATVSGTTWSATVPTALAAGTYDIQVTATDAAGNTGTATQTGGLVIDQTAPTVALT